MKVLNFEYLDMAITTMQAYTNPMLKTSITFLTFSDIFQWVPLTFQSRLHL